MAIKQTHITDDAVTPCIQKMSNYSDIIKDFKNKHDQRKNQLSDEHKDQNFSEYEKWFDEYWPQIENFRKTIEEFNIYLVNKKDFINKEYAKVKVKKTSVSNAMNLLNKIRSK